MPLFRLPTRFKYNSKIHRDWSLFVVGFCIAFFGYRNGRMHEKILAISNNCMIAQKIDFFPFLFFLSDLSSGSSNIFFIHSFF